MKPEVSAMDVEFRAGWFLCGYMACAVVTLAMLWLKG
jgi:hypothetical protein